MASHNNENVVTHNPFEGENGATMRNQAIDAGVGFGVSFAFFALMFIIATIIDVAA
ncbi:MULTISPECIES: YqzM family protein [Lysinibacillus]|uniref:YqzM family protein n=1 Tax=Lysinibacillus antri TaxID=2498145 RepID=A0A432LGN8_9BACI|nr:MULTISPECIES: YqzM family protein [Lysinibacillus]RUL57068.1 YqzM family protein [Lysinibacillus antri]TSI03299.1 YqzM family protein [Lysinibacillus sp. BW-2-10]